MIDGLRGRPSLHERDRDVIVSNGDAIFKLKDFFETKNALEPFRTLFRMTDGKSKMTDVTDMKWRSFHWDCYIHEDERASKKCQQSVA